MLTRAQRKALLYIQDVVDQTGRTPCYDDICAHLGLLHRPAAFRVVRCLIERGFLSKKRCSHQMTLEQRIAPIVETYVFDDATKVFRRHT